MVITAERNGIGFSGPDAEILSSFACQYPRRRSLCPKQMNLLQLFGRKMVDRCLGLPGARILKLGFFEPFNG
jgi:hypothetical protein